MKINVKRLSEKAVVPKYAKHGDAAMDLTATSVKRVDEGGYGYFEYGTDLQIEIPYGHVGLILPRSSISYTGMLLANAVATIDSGYRGEIKCRFKAIPNSVIYAVGERIAQLLILPYPHITLQEVEELSATERGEDGFGSSGSTNLN
jgi:dUTP pyrophosphatase